MAMIAPKISYPEALRQLADAIERNEQLEKQLRELQGSQKEVLNTVEIAELMGVSRYTVSEWVREWEHDPENSPLLNRYRRKGEAVKVLKWDLYEWLKNRRR